MLKVPVLRPEVAREYEEYQAAVDEYNRRRMEEMRKPTPGAPVCMAYAHAAPRCAHVRADGTRCAAPALQGRSMCYAHTRMLMARKPGLKLPVLEDAGGIALAAMQVVQQMLDGRLPRRKAATALYGIQIVASALNHRPFAVQPTSVVMEAEGLPPEEELVEKAGASETNESSQGAAGGERKDNATGGDESIVSKNAGQDGNQPAAEEEAEQDEVASDQAAGEQPLPPAAIVEECEEARPKVLPSDIDPSLRSGLSAQAPLSKEWWAEWETRVRAIAEGAGKTKEVQGVNGDVREEGVG